MLQTDHDLISEILNPNFDWGFAFRNSPMRRHEGDQLLISCICPYNNYRTKVTIIRVNQKYYLVGHLHLYRYKEKKLTNYQALIEYKERFDGNYLAQIMDLNYPLYNIEWSFEIEETKWKEIKNQLKEIDVPFVTRGVSGTRRTLHFKNLNNSLFFDSHSEDSRIEPLNDFMNDLLNYALKDVDKAYYVGTLAITEIMKRPY